MHINLNSVIENKITPGLYDHFISHSNFAETLNALIIDRVLKLIIKAEPTIASDPSSGISKQINGLTSV